MKRREWPELKKKEGKLIMILYESLCNIAFISCVWLQTTIQPIYEMTHIKT